jgi:hypothetical protein
MAVRRLLASIWLVMCLVPRALAADSGDGGLTALREALYCEILSYLRAIHEQAHVPTPEDRYLIVDVAGRDGYVQCLLYKRDRKVLCEVASGFYGRPGDHYVSADRMSAIAALGYSTDASKGNYQQRLTVKNRRSLETVAELIVRSLYYAYAAAPGDPFRFKAPLVKVTPPGQSYLDGRCEAATS